MWQRTLAMMTLLVMIFMFTLPVMAHHSVAAYRDDEIKLRGTVTEYVWRNPHVMIVFTVKDDSGKVVEWTGELASVTSMLAYGVTKNTVKPGDDLLFGVRPSKAGTPTSIIDWADTPDGTRIIKDCYNARRDAKRAVCQQ
jgi:hypothetical protein